MKVKFSKALIDNFKEKGLFSSVLSYIDSIGRKSHFYRYVTDSTYARSYNLSMWAVKQYGNPIIEAVAVECIGKTTDETAKNIVKYWMDYKATTPALRLKGFAKGGIIYKGDMENYGKRELWADIETILEKGKDDCDGFMTLIGATLHAAGIPETRFDFVIGDVQGGGHAYIVYLSDNGLEYPLDGCYWANSSYNFKISYPEHPKYNYGMTEWDRFDSTGNFLKK